MNIQKEHTVTCRANIYIKSGVFLPNTWKHLKIESSKTGARIAPFSVIIPITINYVYYYCYYFITMTTTSTIITISITVTIAVTITFLLLLLKLLLLLFLFLLPVLLL